MKTNEQIIAELKDETHNTHIYGDITETMVIVDFPTNRFLVFENNVEVQSSDLAEMIKGYKTTH